MRLILTLFIVCLAASLSAKEVYSPSEAQQLLKQAKLELQLASLKSSPPSEVINFSRELLATNQESNLAKEYLLFQTTRTISDLPASNELKTLLIDLSAYDSQVYWQTTHVGRIKETLAYPIAGTAAGILNDWKLSEQSTLLSSNGAVDFVALEQFFTGEQTSEKEQIFKRTLAKSSADDLLAITSWAKDNSDVLTLKQKLTLATEARDAGIASLAYKQLQSETSASGDVIRALNKLANEIPATEAWPLYEDLLHSSAYGSVAVNLIHQSNMNSDKIEQTLINVLGNKSIGGDAAFALSQRMSSALVNSLVEKLADDNRIIAKRAELALSLTDDLAAKRALEDFKRSIKGQGVGQ